MPIRNYVTSMTLNISNTFTIKRIMQLHMLEGVLQFKIFGLPLYFFKQILTQKIVNLLSHTNDSHLRRD